MVADTSMLMNLKRGGLLEQCLSLPLTFRMPDLLYRSILQNREAGSGFAESLLSLGLEVVELSGEDVGRAIRFRREHRSLTLPDSLALASRRRRTLLSDDFALKALARQLKVTFRGVLWLIEQTHWKGVASRAAIASGLEAIRAHPRSGLPDKEIAGSWTATPKDDQESCGKDFASIDRTRLKDPS